jgi:hypothetical protein
MRSITALISLCTLLSLITCGPGTDDPIENRNPCPKELVNEIKSINLGISLARLAMATYIIGPDGNVTRIANDIADANIKKEYTKLRDKCDSLLKSNQQQNGCVFTNMPGGAPNIFNNDFCVSLSPK